MSRLVGGREYVAEEKARTYWAIRLNYIKDRKALAGVWFWPDENPRQLNGTALFRTRQQAREYAWAYNEGKTHPDPQYRNPLGRAVKVRVTVEEV